MVVPYLTMVFTLSLLITANLKQIVIWYWRFHFVRKTFGATVTNIYYPCYHCVMVASYRL